MALSKEGLFAITVYILVLMSYVWFILFVIAFSSIFTLSVLFNFLYLILILFGHGSSIPKLKVRYSEALMTFDCNNKGRKTIQAFLFGPFAFGDARGFENMCKFFNEIHEKFSLIVYGVKGALILLYAILFGLYIDSKFQIVTYVVFLTLMVTFGLFRFELIQIIWFFIVIAIPLVLLLVVNVGIIPLYMCFHDHQQAQNRQNQGNNQPPQPPVQNNQQILAQLNGQQANRQIPQQPQPQLVNPQQAEQFGLFARVQRVPTVKVMGDMLKQWRRSYSIKENEAQSCGVCLEEFKKGEQIIELHGGKGHIFHPACIEDWAKRNKSCPLGRTDFVELARREQIDKPALHEEVKEDPNAHLPVRI